MKLNIFILVPSFSPTGPVKGAFALANELVSKRKVTIVSLKNGKGADAFLDNRVKQIYLSDFSSNFFGRLSEYQQILKKTGARENVVSISYCLSADLLNFYCKKYALICSSVRGNLIKIYRLDYGIIGLPAAIYHLISLSRFDFVVSMSISMSKQISHFSFKKSKVIGNFIDEFPIEKYRISYSDMDPCKKHFVFVGSVSNRKRPILLINAIKKLHDNMKGVEIVLDIIGDGPMISMTQLEVKRLGIQKSVRFHGYLAEPYSLIARADAFVLPSLSEGISRASLEALFLGVPCVLKKVDGNSELIEEGKNGTLFNEDDELVDVKPKIPGKVYK